MRVRYNDLRVRYNDLRVRYNDYRIMYNDYRLRYNDYRVNSLALFPMVKSKFAKGRPYKYSFRVNSVPS